MFGTNGVQMEGLPRWNSEIEDQLIVFPIYLRLYENIKATSYHRQPGIEIHITHEGNAVLSVNQKVMPQRPKQVVIFRADTPHQLVADSSKPYRRTVICIDDVQLELQKASHIVDLSWIKIDELYNFPIKPATYPIIDRLCRQASEEIADKRSGWQRMSFAYILEMTVLLQRMVEEGAHQQASHDLEVSGFIQNCIDFIEANYKQDFSLTTVADIFSISPEHLTRSFRKELGISYHQYIIQRRIEESKRLLQFSKEMSILDVALDVGFDSASHFCRTFRQLYDETPSSYRKRTKVLKK